MAKKVRGGKITTTVENQNIIDREEGLNTLKYYIGEDLFNIIQNYYQKALQQ